MSTQGMPPGPAAPQPLKAPAGTDVNTVWIWLLVGIQILPLITAVLLPWGGMFDYDLDDPAAAMRASLSIYLSPLYWLSIALGWAVYGFGVYFAYLDHRVLGLRGVPSPFHWAFAFLGGIVYVVGRAIVVHRRTGAGYAPLWAAGVCVALSFVVAGVITAVTLDGIADLIQRSVRDR